MCASMSIFLLFAIDYLTKLEIGQLLGIFARSGDANLKPDIGRRIGTLDFRIGTRYSRTGHSVLPCRLYSPLFPDTIYPDTL